MWLGETCAKSAVRARWLQTSNTLTCPLRCVAPSKVVANAAVRRLIQRLKVQGTATCGPLQPTQEVEYEDGKTLDLWPHC
jgi:hypothetical protein